MKYESLDLCYIKATFGYVIILLFIQFQTYNMLPRPLTPSSKILFPWNHRNIYVGKDPH